MKTNDVGPILTQLCSELVDGANTPGGAFVLNSGDAGVLRSLDKLSAAEASYSVHDGATIAAHAQHLRYGLSLMNRWASEGGDPYSDAKWDEAWRTSHVNAGEWDEIRNGLRNEAHRWLRALGSPRDVSAVQLTGMIATIVHVAYHLGAMRQISKTTRGPREGTTVRRLTSNSVRSFLFDIVHHRGQITTYLRPMGSTVPQIYGPSADEP